METVSANLPDLAGTSPFGLIAGLPTALTYLTADLCRDMLARVYGACEVVVLNDLGAESVGRIAAANERVLFLTEVPDAAVVAMAKAAEWPLLVLDQRFGTASRDFMAAREAGVLDAVRTMARCQIGLEELADAPRAIVFGAEVGRPASELVDRIATAFSIGAGAARALIDQRGCDRPLCDVLTEVFAYEKMLPNEEVDGLLDRLDVFYGFCPDGRMPTLDVPMATLLEATAPHMPATNPIDLMGPARCLTFGPYLYLPRGRWKARFTFLSKGNASSNTLGFDIVTAQHIEIDRTFDVTVSGKFAFDCEFAINDPHSPIEFRTFLRRGSIEGRFQPLSPIVERSDSAEFAKVLESAFE